MCYAIPGRVVAIDDAGVATISYFGELRKARNELEGLEPGHFVYAQGGFVIERLQEAAAQEVLSVWKESFFDLRAEDLRLSLLPVEERGSPEVARILKKASSGVAPDDQEAVSLLSLDNEAELELLYKTANFLRCRFQGNSCCIHGILEFSSDCTRSCIYCGLSEQNRGLLRYRMSAEEIEAAAIAAIDGYGFKALVLQSGEVTGQPLEDLIAAVAAILRKRAVLIIISPGEIGREGLEELYRAGARGLLMRFETSDAELYEQLHPGCTHEERLETLRTAIEIGYFIITGSIVGLPGQSAESLVKDIRLAAEGLNTAMFSFGPFIPHPDTPLANHPVCGEKEMLKVLALIRILYPEQGPVLVTTALETIDPGARGRGLLCGANSLMLNATPEEYRKQYSLYPGRAHAETSIQEQVEAAIGLLRGLGRAPTDLGIFLQ